MDSTCEETLQEPGANGHKPVLLKEVVRLLNPSKSQTYLDCTFGGGGHTRAILESADCKVVAIDRDPAAAARAEKFKAEFGDRFEFYPVRFSQLDKLQTKGYAGILFDFGVSSFQLDDASRGFSFMRNGPIDMRMNNSEGPTALQFIRSIDEFELTKILREYGEERRAKKIAHRIKEVDGHISTTAELASAIAEAAPSHEKTHPATRAFQAIRIALNGELDEIESALPKAFDILSERGIMAAISFHSLEDRITKRFFKKVCGLPQGNFDRTCAQDRVKLAELLTRKPITPSEDELRDNPRSRSSKLRAVRKD